MLLLIIRDNFNAADSIQIQQPVQARAGNNKSETVKHAARVVEEKKKITAQHEGEEGQQMQFAGWLAQKGTARRTILSFPGYAALVMPNGPSVKSSLAEPPRTPHDGRVGALIRTMKECLEETQGTAELDVLEDL